MLHSGKTPGLRIVLHDDGDFFANTCAKTSAIRGPCTGIIALSSPTESAPIVNDPGRNGHGRARSARNTSQTVRSSLPVMPAGFFQPLSMPIGANFTAQGTPLQAGVQRGHPMRSRTNVMHLQSTTVRVCLGCLCSVMNPAELPGPALVISLAGESACVISNTTCSCRVLQVAL